MSFSLYDNFMNLFTAQKPKDYHEWQLQRDVGGVTVKAKTLDEMQTEHREKGTVFSEKDKLRQEVVPELVEARKLVDQLQVTVLHMIPRWQETTATKVTEAIDSTQTEVEKLREQIGNISSRETDSLVRPKAEEVQLKDLNDDLDGIETTLENERKELAKRKDMKVGEGSDFVNWGLKQGWVPPSKPGEEGTFQYQSKEEWESLEKRGVNQVLQTEKMVAVVPKVHIRPGQDLELAKRRLEVERGTAAKLRTGMTNAYKARMSEDGPVRDGVVNNIDFAKKLASIVGGDDFDPKVLIKADKAEGLMNRVMGSIQGQGQTATGTPPKEVATTFQTMSAESLNEGEANRVQQFISGFVDGLTEVNETNKTAEDQFEALWPKMEATFGLKPADKARLMERVDVYKKLAGGLADTGMSGKAIRKGKTRGGEMTLGDNTIDDPEAIIANDISGSMHSQFLAMELAETLGQPVAGIKEAGSSVQVKNKDVLNARMLDALTLTAGGKFNNGAGDDFVMHTAYEMINGVQAITGVANKVTQKTATAVMEALGTGKSFSEAMEDALPDEVFPWQLTDAAAVDKRAVAALKTAREGSSDEKNLVAAAVDKLVTDVMWMADADEPSDLDVSAIQESLTNGASLTAAMQARFKRETFPWVPKEK